MTRPAHAAQSTGAVPSASAVPLGNGASGRPAGEPVRVKDHDFPDRDLGKAIPYGIYDVAADAGWVNVGCMMFMAAAPRAIAALRPSGRRARLPV